MEIISMLIKIFLALNTLFGIIVLTIYFTVKNEPKYIQIIDGETGYFYKYEIKREKGIHSTKNATRDGDTFFIVTEGNANIVKIAGENLKKGDVVYLENSMVYKAKALNENL